MGAEGAGELVADRLVVRGDDDQRVRGGRHRGRMVAQQQRRGENYRQQHQG